MLIYLSKTLVIDGQNIDEILSDVTTNDEGTKREYTRIKEKNGRVHIVQESISDVIDRISKARPVVRFDAAEIGKPVKSA